MKSSYLFSELKNTGRGRRPVEKSFFLNNAGLFLSSREKVLNKLKSKIFQKMIKTKLEHLNQYLNHHLYQQYFIHLNEKKAN